ncbi:MAG: Lrp/AsnC family transcriptional regulator [Pseudomonadota bacterium]|nr:Lrp/AsnC family transcriptional regulator [Pseudomonadota bacterium]
MARNALDRIDLKILEALQRDGRISNNNLAKLVSLSPSACLVRLRTLEASGVIVDYQAHVALEKVRDVMEVYAEITMGQHLATVFRTFEDALSRIPEIVEVVRVSGPFDYLLKVVVSDMNEWKDISQGFLNTENGVVKLMTLVVMQQIKISTSPPLRPNTPRVRRELVRKK